MNFKFLISALALLCASGNLVQASETTGGADDFGLTSTEEHQLERRGGDSGKALTIVGGIAGMVGGILTLQPELVAYGAVLTAVSSATTIVNGALSRRDGEFNLGNALVQDEPALALHSAEKHASGNWTNYVLSGRNKKAANSVYMELTHYHKSGRLDGLVVGSKTGLSRRAVQNAQHVKFSFNVIKHPKEGYDKTQLNRFASNMAKTIAAKKRDTSCHGSLVKGAGAWHGKVVIGTLDQLKKKQVVNDCSKDPKAYGPYFNEKHKGKAARASSFVEEDDGGCGGIESRTDVRPDEVPTAANIGRQLKKIKVAMDLDGLDAIQNVDETSGQRFATAVDMAVKHVVHAQQGQQHMLAAIRLALAEACGPGGTITAAITAGINAACGPGGTIAAAITGGVTAGITAACGPGGAISTMADRAQQLPLDTESGAQPPSESQNPAAETPNGPLPHPEIP
ncbi:hypothetical protein HDU97_009043 [Phlyctochytrium planicorne]|nr:hypothetical protein HDU97_009043 [Phlyctochytrium planicorne]